MPNLETKARQCLKEFDFRTLFIEEMGWDHHVSSIEVFVDGLTYTLSAVAQKRGMVVFVWSPADDEPAPDYSTRRKIEKQVAKSVHEHLIIYEDKDSKSQIWQWVKREAGKPTQCREHRYYCSQPGDSLLQKLKAIAFSLDEEEGLTIVDVATRVRVGFDVDRVTKRFYDRFKSEHDTFLTFLKGIPDEEMQRWYASVMLNRLMFIYFIQKKGFLDSNINYLQDKLTDSEHRGKDRFYKDFLCPLFFEGFAKRENERKTANNQLLGKVPFLNGGIFQPHQLEEHYGKSIQIGDAAFQKLFSFFDQYQWHLDERPLRADNEINPDVLGYIFEKYINQKQMGAYYTKEDITEYISKDTIIPYLFDEAKKKCRIAFEGEQSIWRLLQADPDRYIYDAVKKGVDLPLPAETAVGLNDVSKRTEWNKSASEKYALPTEIWREVVERRSRYQEVRSKLLSGEIRDINDFVTHNLNIRQFAQDVIENCESPDLLRAFWHAIDEVTVLDPTCGSGAFLFAALNILEPLYEGCLERMEVFLEELERSEERHRPEKFGDFRKILDRIEQHPNRRYFIFKSIIVNNLYGVDIMEEAIEICKLRLFLKLVAQVGKVENIEPLPDIDFNIRAGNTLVGYATYDEVKRAVLGDTQGKLDLGKDMERIDQKADDVDRLFKLFRKQQTELGGEVTHTDKQELRRRLEVLEYELNCYLAGEYRIESDNKDEYEKWLISHKPFHWFIEFYGIMIKKGGFDVVIGNPPYVEYKDVLSAYTVQNFATEDCSNLFAFVLERSAKLCHSSSEVGMIIPLSAFSTERMIPLISHLKRNSYRLHVSNFSWRPGKLFDGVNLPLSIVLQKVGDPPAIIKSTRYLLWDSNARPELFTRIDYSEAMDERLPGCIPKLGATEAASVIRKLRVRKKEIGGCFTRHSKNIVYYRRGGLYWKVFVDFETGSSEEKLIHLLPEIDKYCIIAALSSGLWWWYFTITSDCRHLGNRDINTFPFDPREINLSEQQKLSDLGREYVLDLRKNAGNIVRIYKRQKSVGCLSFKVGQSKKIIDEIDHILAKHYDLTDEELDFVINYDIKYRMGRDSEGEEED